MNAALSRFLLVATALGAAHEVADHWVQTHDQASTKGAPGAAGRRACAAHVATYTATGAAAVLLASRRLGLRLAPASLAAGLALNAVTHYAADRRAPLHRLAVALGKAGYLEQPTGPFHLDQSWHYGWIFLSALLAAGRC